MKRDYQMLWNWLLDKGLFVAALIINSFFAAVGSVSMLALHFFLKWWNHFK